MKNYEGLTATFVQEGMTHAIDFRKEPNREIAALNVAQCHLLEITNRDENEKRTVMSLSHLMVPHLLYQRNLDQSVRVAIDNFVNCGGEINTAKFRIFGGVAGENVALRDNLKKSIRNIVPSAEIDEPKGHESKRNPQRTLFGPAGESIDYLLGREGTTYRKLTLEAIKSEDETKDEVSKNLKDASGKFDPNKIQVHQSFIDNQWSRVRREITEQTELIFSNLERGVAVMEQIYKKMDEAETNPSLIPIIAKLAQAQVELMSLKVCDRNGSMMQGLEVTAVVSLVPGKGREK